MRPKGEKSYCVWGSGPDGCHFPPGWPTPSSNSEPCNGLLPGLGVSYTTDIDSGHFVQVPWSVADRVNSPLTNDSMFMRPLGLSHDEVHLEAGAPPQLLSNGDLVHFYAGMTPGPQSLLVCLSRACLGKCDRFMRMRRSKTQFLAPGFSACGNWTGKYTASWMILDGSDPSHIVGRWDGPEAWLNPTMVRSTATLFPLK